MNILIVKLSAIGDVIHTLPSLAALRRCFPAADITWVVEEAAADLLAGHPDLDRVIVSGRKRWLREIRQGQIGEVLGEMQTLLRALRARCYDWVIDFHGLLKSAVLVGVSRGKRKLGYDSLQEGSCLFYSEKVPEDMGKHAVDRYLDLVRRVAGPQGEACLAHTPTFTIGLGDQQERRVTALLKEHWELLAGGGQGRGIPGEGVQGLRFVAVNPVAFWETKLWQEEKFAELCDRVRRELGVGIVLTGGEAPPLERIRGMMAERAANLGGRTTLRELACLYKRAALVVTTDSGPMHLAAAVGTPVVALFGPTDPARTGPYGPGHRVVRRELACSPCLKKRCETQRCMREIEVGEVFAAVREGLSGTL